MTGRLGRRLRAAAPVLFLAALAYVPLAFTGAGKVGADTKSYLYLDPSRMLARATSMWDPNIGFGTVTHQNIGYLFPMGPYYWLMQALGSPDWFAQRIWLGSILFAAGTGVLFLLRTIGWQERRGAATVAALAYMLTPFTLTLAARISVILLPWAGLPWLIALAARAVRRGGWRDPALFALVVLTIGGVNATALVFAAIGPLLWFPHAIWVAREATVRQVLAAVLRIGSLTAVTSLWWLSGLVVQGRYGIDILRYTETAKVVAASSVAPEVLRGLGYWFFYGGDRLGPWIEPGKDYTQRLWLIAVTYATPILAVVGAVVARWRHRAYFVALVFVGTFIAVGAYPWGDPPLTGALWKRLLLSSAGLALRSTPRAVPLVALGLAVLLGSGLVALAGWLPRLARPAAVALGVLAIAGMPPLFTGGMVASNLQRPEDVPSYWTDAAAWLDGQGDATRVLEVPGADFASYRWGNTVDPITPGLMDRPYAARELIPYGSPASADLLNAFDRRMQENVLEPSAIAPIARLMGVGDVVVRSDLQYERYRTPRPRNLWDLISHAPGLGEPTGFGGNPPNRASDQAPLLDELELATPPSLPDPPRVAALPVSGAVPIVHTAPSAQPVLLAGDGEGLVEAASAGLLDGTELVQFAASLAGSPDAIDTQLSHGASLVLTDSNRRRGRRWSTVRENTGYTEQAGEEPLRTDLSDNRLPVFPDAGDGSYTLAEHRGGVSARATSYGNPITFTPEYRPANAVDGDLDTAWRVGAFSDVRGERLIVTYDPPVTADHLELLQMIEGFRNRTITQIDLSLDGDTARHVQLDERSLSAPGQRIDFSERTFSELELTIRGDDAGPRDRYNGLSQVGITELTVDDRTLDEVVRLPTDLLSAAGTSANDHELTVLLARQRTDPAEAVREDEETRLVRAFSLPSDRSFALAGTARLSARAPDDLLDTVLGQTGVVATSSRRLPGDITARASSAIDGDPSTWWSPGFDVGEDWLDFRYPAPITIDGLDLQVVADGRHSVPTQLRVEADDQPPVVVDVPPIEDGSAPDTVVRASPIHFADPLTGSHVRITITAVREVRTTDWFSDAEVRMPVGIAELGLPSSPGPDGAFDSGCRTDLLTRNGEPVPIQIRGTVADAVAREPLSVSPCDTRAGRTGGSLDLTAGETLLRAADGRQTGIDLDRLVLQSAAGGGAAAEVGPVDAARSGGPAMSVTGSNRTSFDLAVTGAVPGEPFWVVLGQSLNDGWTATVDGHDLGAPQLVDGYANGWLVDPSSADVDIHLAWTPQRLVTSAEVVSLAGAILCVVLALRRPRRGAAAPATVDPLAAPVQRNRLLRSVGHRPRLGVAVTTSLVLAAVFGAAVGLVAGLLTGAATFAAARIARARWVVALGAPAMLAAAGLYVVAKQAKGRATWAFEWPGELSAVHQVAWLAVALLVAEVIVDRLWSGSFTPRPSGDGPASA